MYEINFVFVLSLKFSEILCVCVIFHNFTIVYQNNKAMKHI
jgi:hypothetical protein